MLRRNIAICCKAHICDIVLKQTRPFKTYSNRGNINIKISELADSKLYFDIGCQKQAHLPSNPADSWKTG